MSRFNFMQDEMIINQFAEATTLALDKFYIDAAKQFEEISQSYPEHELADDAMFNAGMCYFHLNSFEHAIAVFEEVIEKYPDAQIHEFEGGNSYGKTAAKCHYAILNSYLGLSKFEDAEAQLAKLNLYPDAYELSPLGEKFSYEELGNKALQSFKKFEI
ncbi:tetratricopeptide repeat protein [Mucilaginibacter sp. KACC 22063]|uniref:tetratricopeptide repeat protein n=1 Tax=Mucilaginibacter sp. KACC 22063 TaxID=3025666 RepID=UPI002365B200|nr:tetratricopeptide repeat protein [Mucilaginibacter sp. KACC 22063]WDF55450.1 tetratricopeptide repeat protein [Mucilaginibacter sp. KACC 22063]